MRFEHTIDNVDCTVVTMYVDELPSGRIESEFKVYDPDGNRMKISKEVAAKILEHIEDKVR